LSIRKTLDNGGRIVTRQRKTLSVVGLGKNKNKTRTAKYEKRR